MLAICQATGMIDPFEARAKRLLLDHVTNHRRHLELKANASTHVRQTESYIKKILVGCGFKTICDFSASRVANWLSDLRANGRIARTSNAYLTSIKAFSRWLVRDRRATEDVLVHLSALNVKVDIPYEDEAGRVFDFHSLRHQFISDLVRGGVHPKEAQTLARHSTITLTMDRYTHVGIVDLTAALERLPAISDKTQSNENAKQLATGTDGPVDGKGKVAVWVPPGAKNGAARLASGTSENAPDCTENGQRASDFDRNASDESPAKSGASSADSHESSSACIKAEGRGLEPLVQNAGKTGVSTQSGAKSGALSTEAAVIDPNLAHVVGAWPVLPTAIKKAILALVEASGGADG
jgi:hypothetical protein